MAKQIITTALTAILFFIAGAAYNNAIFYNANSSNRKIIKAQDKVILKAEEVMDNNGLYDTDGSDTMAEYMEAYNKVQTLYATQQ